MTETEKTEIAELIADWRDENRAYHEEHRAKFAEIDRVLKGDYDRPGISVRVKRIEEVHEDRKKWCGIVVGAAITSTLGAIVSWIAKITNS